MARVEIYTKPLCGYCFAAKKLLDGKGVSYEQTDLFRNPGKRSEMIQRAHGRSTVPQIFIDGTHVGGFDDLSALDRAGKLDPMLAS